MPSINIEVSDDEYEIMSKIKGDRLWKDVLKTKLPKIPVSAAFTTDEYNKLLKIKEGSWRELIMDLYNKVYVNDADVSVLIKPEKVRQKKQQNKEEQENQALTLTGEQILTRPVCKKIYDKFCGAGFDVKSVQMVVGDLYDAQSLLDEMVEAKVLVECNDNDGQGIYYAVKGARNVVGNLVMK